MKFFQKSLQARLVGYFFLLSSVIVILLGVISYKFFIKDIKQAIIEELNAIATLKEGVLIRWVSDQRQDVVQMVNLQYFRDKARVLFSSDENSPEYKAAYSSILTHLYYALQYNPDLLEIFLLSEKGGEVVLSTEPSSEGNYRVQDTFFIEGREKTFVQTVYPSAVTLKPTMTISTPLYDNSNKLVGVLAANLNLDQMDRIIQEPTGLGKRGETYLVDRFNTFTSSERFGSEEFPRGVHSTGIDSAIKGIQGSGIYLNYRGIPVIGVYRWIEPLDMALFVEVQKKEAFTSTRRRFIPLSIIGLLLVVLLAVGVHLLAKRIVKPVVSVRDAALRVADGNLDSKVPVITHDEIGVLAESFNQMTFKLKTLYDEIRKNEEHFRALIESSTDIIAVFDQSGVTKFFSPSVERTLGYNLDELLGRNAFELIYPEDISRIKDVFSRTVEEGFTFYRVVLRVMDKNGGWRTFEATVKNLLDNPAVSGIVVNARDITEKTKAENALRESEERYRSFFEEDLTGDYIATPDGAVLSCNPAFARILGFSSIEDVKKHNLYSFYSDALNFEKFLEVLEKNKKLEYFEKEMRNIQGKQIYVVENAIGRFNGAGKLVEIQGYIFDNTERRQLEEKLYHVQKMEAVGRLAGGIAHDFNNLLTAIIGYSEMLLLKNSLDKDSYANVHEIKKAADRAALLTQQLLAYGRKQVLQPKVIDLNQLVMNMEMMLKRLLREDIYLKTKLDSGLMPIKADPGQIEQVIMNLVVNARDAMPNGGKIIIETKNTFLDESYCEDYPEISPGTYVMLSINDSGCGMDEETRAKIFDPFFTTKEVGKGTGLGLSTVFGIIKQSDGHISVDSDVNRGSTFTIYLPIIDDSNESYKLELDEKKMQNGNESILVVEDEEVVRRMIYRILSNIGYNVYEVKGPTQAISLMEKLKNKKIELLITDIVMPQMNGRKLAAKLLKQLDNLKVLYISGYTEDGILHQGILKEDVSYLQKPFTPDVLAHKVREVLDAK